MPMREAPPETRQVGFLFWEGHQSQRHEDHRGYPHTDSAKAHGKVCHGGRVAMMEMVSQLLSAWFSDRLCLGVGGL